MRKVFQIISIGIAAYNLYLLVDDFLQTPQGQKVKDTMVGYAEPYIEKAKDVAEQVMDRLEEEAPVVAEETVNEVDSVLHRV